MAAGSIADQSICNSNNDPGFQLHLRVAFLVDMVLRREDWRTMSSSNPLNSLPAEFLLTSHGYSRDNFPGDIVFPRTPFVLNKTKGICANNGGNLDVIELGAESIIGRIADDIVEKMGIGLTNWEGKPVKLSEIIGDEGCNSTRSSRTGKEGLLAGIIIVSKNLSDPIRSHKDLDKDSVPQYHKAVKFYEGLSKQLVNQGHVLDLFACALDQVVFISVFFPLLVILCLSIFVSILVQYVGIRLR
ncbi:hypothetical protein HHK36_028395 [Tetracentron sinense]|uniref:Protein transport protein SEC23 n=1 Tax=Tetracentron sinense TaxID=13715 RepID=A0A834YGA9_TETSI|nr:hypothetical protein HHK36_028395 [Tetracentron sinense]